MSALFRREVRRLSYYGLLGPVAFLLALLADLSTTTNDFTEMLLLVGLMLAPAVLGVATVAPDTSSGGTTFFARMPISPGQVLTAKLKAAGVWLLIAIPLGFLVGISGGDLDPVRQIGSGTLLAFTATLQMFAFGCGLLASVIASRVMPALLLAPAFAAIAYLFGAITPAALFRIELTPATIPILVAPAMTLAFVVAAFVAYTRGQRHLTTPRPLLLAGAVLAPALVLWVGGAGIAQAWTASAAVPGLVATPDVAQADAVTAIAVTGRCWNGEEERVVVVSGDATWTVPERWVRNPMLSPDGKHLLVSSKWERGGFLIDLTTKSVRPVPHGRSKEGFGFQHVMWRPDGTPLFVEVRGAVIRCFDVVANEIQVATLQRPIAGVAGVSPQQTLVVWDAEGIYELPNLIRWPVPPSGSKLLARDRAAQPTSYRVHATNLGETLKLETKHAFEKERLAPAINEAVLSPTGRYVMARTSKTIHVFDLRRGGRHVLRSLKSSTPRAAARRMRDVGSFAAQRFGAYVYGFSPDDEHLVVERFNGLGIVVQLGRRTSQRFNPPRPSPLGLPVVWSGRRAVLPSGVTIDLDPHMSLGVKHGRTFTLGRIRPVVAWTERGGVPLLEPLQFLKGGAR